MRACVCVCVSCARAGVQCVDGGDSVAVVHPEVPVVAGQQSRAYSV